ncbi:MAG: alpha/beta fold hydrolase [bacterium]
MPPHHLTNLRATELSHHGDSRQLLMVLHGAWASPAQLLFIRNAIDWILPDADLLIPAYPAGVLEHCPPTHMLRDLTRLVQEAVAAKAETGTPYEEIILMGYSLGGALALRLALVLREICPVPVSRVVSMAGINFGWTLFPVPATMPVWLKAFCRFWFRLLLTLRLARTMRAFEYGRRFGRESHDAWMTLLRDPDPDPRLPWMVYLAGKQDEFTHTLQYRDFIGHPQFRLMLVPHTMHLNILLMDDSEVGRERQLGLRMALRGDLANESYVPSTVIQAVPIPDSGDPTPAPQ